MLVALRDALVQVKKSVGKSDKKSGKKSDKKILDHLKDYPTATLEELQGLTGLSSGGIRKAIRRLKDAKLLRRVGPDKGGHWEVMDFVKRVVRDRKIPFELSADRFYGEANMRHLRASAAAARAGRVKEHELIED